MKYLLIPGFPLLVIAMAYHDSSSMPFFAVFLIATSLLLAGVSGIIIYLVFRIYHFLSNRSHE